MTEEHTIWKYKLGAEMEESKAELKKLRAEAEKQSAEKKQELLKQIDSLEKKRQELDEKFQKTKTASKGAAQELQKGIGDAWNEFQRSVKKATEKFKETD